MTYNVSSGTLSLYTTLQFCGLGFVTLGPFHCAQICVDNIDGQTV